ncbi:MAG: insulinase family protein [Micavibrio aeruginosavorus]|uniref:Insulinase family protein n=1 Tax=Micavibrio aeruginosavorus TaxID=349221 RepID=A0A2W5MX57_9BACT|nr:MAG: insulinase family protein [Micavibrio aeruginosavorus]
MKNHGYARRCPAIFCPLQRRRQMFKDKRPGKWILLGSLLVIIMLGLLIFFGMQAQAAKNQPFLPIKEVKTKAGISVWLAEDHSLPIVALRFVFLDAGSANDPDDRQGLARMLSNTMDEGAGKLDSQSFQKALSDNSITLSFNASRDGFGGELKTLKRNEAKAFDLLAMAINEPRFDAEPLARMRDGNLSRIKSSLSEPDWMAARVVNDKAFEGHPYSKNSGGTISSLGRITADDLRNFKKNNLSRDRLLIAVSGDIDQATLESAIDKIFAKLPEKSAGSAIKDTSITNGGKIYLFEQDIPQTFIEVMLPAFDHKDKDYYALELMNYIYGGAGFGSRLMETAREQRGLTYGIYSGTQDYRHTDALNVSTSTKTASTQEMLTIIKDEMVKMQNTPVDAKELQDAKSYITGSMPLALSSTDKIAAMILQLRVDSLPIDYLDHFADYINAVTPEDILRVSKRILKPELATTVLVGKPENIQNVITVKELPNVQ